MKISLEFGQKRDLFQRLANCSAIFEEIFEHWERCKGVHCVDLGESFPTHIFLQNLASIQPRTSPPKFGRSPRWQPSERRARARGLSTLSFLPESLSVPVLSTHIPAAKNAFSRRRMHALFAAKNLAQGWRLRGILRLLDLHCLQDARYVIKSVICDPNFERLVLGCIEADFCK